MRVKSASASNRSIKATCQGKGGGYRPETRSIAQTKILLNGKIPCRQ